MTTRLEDLTGRRRNYEGVGGTQTGDYPPGYHVMTARRQIGTGRAAFDRAVDALLHWQVHQMIGMELVTSADRVAVGAESLGKLGLGPLSIPVPCRVVWMTEEPDRVGYAYGTLDGHPESGEEAFVLTLEGEAVVFTVTAFSRPASWYARFGGPVTRLLQKTVATRYAARLKRLST